VALLVDEYRTVVSVLTAPQSRPFWFAVLSPMTGATPVTRSEDVSTLSSESVLTRERELTSSIFKQNLVVEPQAQLWHPGEEHAHLDGAHNLTAQHVTIGTNLRNRETSQETATQSKPVHQDVDKDRD